LHAHQVQIKGFEGHDVVLKLNKSIPSKGENCWTIGTPADIDNMNSVTEGIVSNIYLNGKTDWTGKMLQVSAPYTHGSSGGALINNRGEVIGITCGGNETKDGARANLNYAISAIELDNLKSLNTTRIVDPNSIPCQLSFYTNYESIGNVYLYVDGIYIGTFNKYFPNNIEPDCNAPGTITRFLYPGTHKIYVEWKDANIYFSGEITLSPGSCKKIPVAPIQRNYNNYPSFYYDDFSFVGRKIEDRGPYEWTIYTGISTNSTVLETNKTYPFSIFVEKMLSSKKYSIRGNIQAINSSPDEYSGYDYSAKYFGMGVDLKRIYYRPYRWNYFLAGTINYRSINKDYDNSYYYYTPPADEGKDGHLFIGIRAGGDRYTTERFYITTDFGYGYNSRFKRFDLDFNFLLGYKFNP